jgi:hypothetical protein
LPSYFVLATVILIIKILEMGRECSTNCERRGILTGYWWGSQKVRDHWEDLDVGGWTILKWILEK